MFLRKHLSRAERRGIVLVLILGMLGLLALIGVTFATLSGQARINARNYMQAQQKPDASELMDFALAQLIDDTGIPTSALRGHSLKRDMYGNDAPGNGLLVYSPTTGATMNITRSTTFTGTNGVVYAKLETDVDLSSPYSVNQFYEYDFTRWYIRMLPAAGFMPDGTPINQFVPPVAQTFEVLSYNSSGSDPTYPSRLVFLVALPDGVSFIQQPPAGTPSAGPVLFLAQPPNSGGNAVNAGSPVPFILDGRYLRAFNGPGMDSLGRGLSMYANFRVNGNIVYNAVNGVALANSTVTPGDPDGQIALSGGGFIQFPSMDEDYDACDLENWFLAIQSADGQIIIPSFHRPGILQVDYTNTPNVDDWQTPLYNSATSTYNPLSAAKFLRPRNIDGHSPIAFPDLKPDSTTGKIKYDIDNDGDGITDSVWLDLGYSPRRDATGKLFKPLFSFMVIGLNGRLPLNTAGNASLRSNSGSPLNAHASHLGNSPSEIDPTWALQNTNYTGFYAQDQTDNTGATTAGTWNSGTATYSPGDSGTSVALTQLRNLVFGMRGYDGGTLNGDTNFVMSVGMSGRTPFPLPNGIADVGDTLAGSSQVVANTSGITVYRQTQTVPGRWGDDGLIPSTISSPGNNPAFLTFQTPVAPGLPSYDYVGGSSIGLTYRGGTGDDNLNVFDPSSEAVTLYDPSSSIFMPVERIRRFVTPIDPVGDGKVLTWDDNSAAIQYSGIGATGVRTYNHPQFPLINDTGADHYGRISFFKYFRPPGIAQATAAYPAGIVPFSSAVLPDLTNNVYHGFEGYRNPKLNVLQDPNSPGASSGNPYYYPINPLVGGMPYNYPTAVIPVPTGQNSPQTPATGVPTFDQNLFSFYASGGVVGSQPQAYYPYAIGNMNEPEEVNLYDPNNRDQLFGFSDLEWLYRSQDSDGASLQSRLSQLAPVSFTNGIDGTRRRRLFSLEAWDTTNFVWANDNPLGVFADAAFALGNKTTRGDNFRFARYGPYSDASFYSLPATAGNNAAIQVFPGYDPLQLTTQVVGSAAGVTAPYPTPSVAHRDRKINLNFPLPVSNSPVEPVRQKWIRETYQLLKAILPPKAVDTPEELAQLSQFVVNMVDFRDTDCTTTKFVNTDVAVTPATATSPSLLGFNPVRTTGSAPTNGDFSPAWDNTMNFPTSTSTTIPLIQHGMEYPPVALMEILAFKFMGQAASGSATDTSRMFVEIVNTLTESNNNVGPGLNACDLDLSGWDFVVLPDDGLGRPDPYTGQIPSQLATNITSYPVAGLPGQQQTTTGSVTPYSVPGAAVSSTLTGFPGLSIPVPALNAGTNTAGNGSDRARNYYYVFGGGSTTGSGGAPSGLTATGGTQGQTQQQLQTTTNDKNAPQMEAYLDLTPALAAGTGKYYWLYLRRPANPFDDTYDPSKPVDSRVVVDSFRFFYNDGKWSITSSSGTPTSSPANEYLYSLQRAQPFRGGQMVAQLGVVGGGMQNAAYGYSEQVNNGAPTAGDKGFLAAPGLRDYVGQNKTTGLKDSKGNTNAQITYPIGQSLGVTPRGNDSDSKWDWLVFNDRDFTSVAELMLVPACPPGLFTKQFIEKAPPVNSPNTYTNIWIGTYGSNPPDATIDPTSTGTLFPHNSPVSFDVTNPKISPTTPNPSTPATISAPSPVAVPHTYPYLADNFFYTGATEYLYPTTGAGPVPAPPYVGGPSGGGWFKMFDFFEVPSNAIGATGLVAQGNNFDWFRQDRRPGQLNPNLIIDEEVFLGLMGFDSSDSYQQAVLNGTATNFQLNLSPMTNAASITPNPLPQVVTQLDTNGNPFNPTTLVPYTGYTYPIPNNGAFVVTNPANGAGVSNLKAAFVDFLRIRSGGTNYLFGMIGGTPVDRPFHSLSYPDINYTVMRPAVPPPLAAATVPLYSNVATSGQWPTGTWPLGAGNYIQDLGIKNPYLVMASQKVQAPPIQPPPIPPRRLFQLPDAYGSPVAGQTALGAASTITPTPPPPAAGSPPSNASVFGDTVNINSVLPQMTLATGVLFNPTFDLTAQSTNAAVLTGITDTNEGVGPFWLGNHNGGLPYNGTTYAGIYDGNNTVNGRILPVVPFQQADMRQHPYYRSEWMQRVMNLTTPRTHQFAVWITVGFFEVTQVGNPQLASTNPSAAYDVLGMELGSLEGTNTRYRGFFLLDRTRAVGFNPSASGDFRNVIVYRKLIE